MSKQTSNKKKLKRTNNWRIKSLNILKNQSNEDDSDHAGLIANCIRLRKKVLNDFTVEDLRLMIGQNETLIYLIPLALEELDKNTLAEGDLFEGDLLTNVLNCDADYWKKDPDSLRKLKVLLARDKTRLDQAGLAKDWFRRK